MKYLIIIPTYNEIENIEKITNEIQKTLSDCDFSILIVDDNSSDGTKEAIKNLKNKYSNVLSLEREDKLGLASAYIDGIKYGIKNDFEYFIQMDADFSHNPKYLALMLEKIKENDVVIASRNVKDGKVIGWSAFRNFISKGGSMYSRFVLSCPIMDLTGGFNGWSKSIINKINLDNIISKGYAFQIEMKYRAYKNKAKIFEFPIIFEDRKYGKSKMSKKIFFEALINVIKIKFIV